MNMLKVLKLSVLSLLIFNSPAFAATKTVYSPLIPLNGTYTFNGNKTCTGDSTQPPLAGYPMQYVKEKIGQHTFTPDITHGGVTSSAAFNAWVTYITGLGLGVTNPTGTLNSLPDTSSTLIPQPKLIETPIQWGSMSHVKSFLLYSSPLTTQPSFGTESGADYIFITSFNYSNPANTNNVKTGYALHSFSIGDTAWSVGYIYFNTTSAGASFVTAIEQNTKLVTMGSTTTPFNCVSSMTMSK